MNLLPDAAEYLRRRVLENLKHVGVDSFFVAWLLPDMVDRDTLKANASSIASKIAGAQRTYQDVATLGFAAECELLDADGIEKLREGLRWMVGRAVHVDGYPADICTDAISLLGISLGLRRLNDSFARPDWIARTCPTSARRANDWEASLIGVAHRISGASIEPVTSDEVKLIAFSKGIMNESPDIECRQRSIERLRATELPLIPDKEIPICLAALRLIESSSPQISINQATIPQVVSVMKAIPSGLQRWTWEDKAKTARSEPRKWYVDHEYHVQNLVWFLLRPLFPDARFEEYKAAVGAVHPRLDIVIPSLRLIIEVKFWRKAVKSDEMIRELAEDVGLYLTLDASYETIVPLIWDEGARTEEHAALIAGLKQMNGIFDAVIIAKPAFMNV